MRIKIDHMNLLRSIRRRLTTRRPVAGVQPKRAEDDSGILLHWLLRGDRCPPTVACIIAGMVLGRAIERGEIQEGEVRRMLDQATVEEPQNLFAM